MSELWTNYIFLLAFCSGSGFGIPNKCDEVRKVFQLREIGPNQLLPLSPRPGMLELIFTVCFFFFFLTHILSLTNQPVTQTVSHFFLMCCIFFISILPATKD